MAADDELGRIVKQVLAPLIWADGGELFVVDISRAKVALHLTGRFAGCPGNDVVCSEVLAPAIRAVSPGTQVQVSSGPIIPPGAVLVPRAGTKDSETPHSGAKDKASLHSGTNNNDVAPRADTKDKEAASS